MKKNNSSWLNGVIVVLTIIIILFITISGFILGDIKNWQPFFPFGTQGVFHGSAAIFFAYVGFDAVATAAEEAKNPQRVSFSLFLPLLPPPFPIIKPFSPLFLPLPPPFPSPPTFPPLFF